MSAALDIVETSVAAPEALRLIAESEAELASLYRPEHRSAFSPEELIAARTVFLVGWRDGLPATCGGYAPLIDPDGQPYAELKRIFTTRSARGQGAARALLGALEDHARAAGLRTLRLETGEASPDAIALYERCGYVRRAPFGPYRENGSSVFMEKTRPHDAPEPR